MFAGSPSSVLGPALLRAREGAPELWKILTAHLPLVSHALEAVGGGPSGWLHGQLYSVNILVRSEPARVVFVDWESLAYGPAYFDLACLLFYEATTPEGRSELIRAFTDAGGFSPGPASPAEQARLLLETELFNQLWLIATLGPGWWTTPGDPSLGRRRHDVSRSALEACLTALA